MAKTLLVLNDPPYGSERTYNALRLAVALSKREGEAVRIFLIGDAASCSKAHQHVPAGFYNVEVMLHDVARRGGEIGVCQTCMEARGITDADLVEGVRRSSLKELADWTGWSEKVLVF